MERPTVLAVAGIFAAGVLIVVAQWHAERVKRRAVLALPPAARAALMARTLTNVETLCHDEALTAQCEAEAQLLAILLECDAACRDKIAAYLSRATR